MARLDQLPVTLSGPNDMVSTKSVRSTWRAAPKSVLAVAVACLLWISGIPDTQADELAGRRPNIVLVMTDDQGKGDLSCLGNPDLRTPNLDRLYSLSTRFSDFHVSPTCAPTRAAMMTGRHEFKSGVTHTLVERERMALDATTVAQALSQAGYATGIFGKWHLGDEEPYQPHNRGFQEVFVHGAGGIGQRYDCSCADAPPNEHNRYFDCVLRHNRIFVQTRGFCTDVFFQAALGWIDRQSQTDQPFFALITPNAPHGPMIAPPFCKQPFLDAGFDAVTAGRYGMIANIDDNMGLLMERLAQRDLEQNTLLIFMTDNGQANVNATRHGQPCRLYTAGFKTGKGSPYEGGTRVPAFWRWKGVLPENREIDELTAHIDIFPTLAGLAGSALPENGQVEGRSLLPLLQNPSAAWPDRLLFTHVGRWAKGSNPDDAKFKNFAVRNSRFRLVNDGELYDIRDDPFETSNVIDQHPEVVQAMRAAFDRWWSEARSGMVNEAVPNSAVRPFHVEYQRQLAEQGIPEWPSPDP